MYKPATPLPWITEHDDRGTCFLRGSDMRPGNAIMNTRRYAGKINAAYIVQACNAYPRLVEMLREYIANDDAAIAGALAQGLPVLHIDLRQGRARALLRELGE